MQFDEKIVFLEGLRKKAWRAYLYLALGLLAAIVVFALLMPLYGIGFGVVILILYFFFLKKDVDSFRQQYQETVISQELGRYIQVEKFAPKDLVPFEQVSGDGCVPVGNTKGIIRVGVSGTYRKQKVQVTDISYVYKMGKQALAISGCYLKLELDKEADGETVLCGQGILPEIILDDYYAGQGLELAEGGTIPEEIFENWRCYGAGASGLLESAGICRSLQRLYEKSGGRMIMKWSGTYFYAFVRFRYLGVCEPDYKNPVTREQLEKQLFPELKEILDINNSL